MGQAREVMDRLTEALTTGTDLKAVMECFAEDAVAITPDGEIRGRDNIGEYWRQMTDAIPDSEYKSVHKHESGNTAIDEGFFTGKNTGPLVLPSGESLEPTQKDVRVRGCDVATVEDGKIVSYRLYFDQLDFLGQLGLLPNAPT
ncbi:nuclear transport factor 2 family protein [Streptomyces sp. ISL-99]|uniref:nuclear transport factor 2 family protein n=1 Tax=Streptomyces sp. ISL-99 TaxID=2819193 RepID=UPI001BE739E1|nr:nuclear transport factor 2 family protein [Streptomyces sp. ISL-99]MBT2527665.1 nuclear transport factor 2 family protein [Streptomyces sp. ISL-99]